MLFSGKNIIVTGASGDLGTAITQRLVTQGAHILAVDFSNAGLSRLAAQVSGPGVLETFVADVSDAAQVLGYATQAFELWGQVDGFVNMAGIQTRVRPIVEFPEEDFDRVDEVRASVDAILVGATTIRRDNPRLLLRSAERQQDRVRRGLAAHPIKVTLTGTGDLHAEARFFTAGDSEKLVYTRDPAVAGWYNGDSAL